MDVSQNVSTFESSPEFAPIGKLAIVIGKQDDGTELVYRSVYDETAYRPPAEDIPDFSSSQKYAVGDYCIYNDYVYRCSTPITSPGEWDSSDWTLISEDNPSWDDVEGYALTVECPWGTQVMANNLLAALGGVTYQPYVAGGALIDPAAELGDAVYVGGITSVVYTMDTTFDALYTADISAPQEEEIDHEYPYEPKANREIARKTATITSELRVDVDTITAMVAGQYADEWENGVAYPKGRVVKITSGSSVSYYSCKLSHTSSSTSKPPTGSDYATYWDAVTSPTVESIVNIGLGGITLSATSGNNSATVTITANGVSVSAPVTFTTITADYISASGITAGTINGSNNTINLKGEINLQMPNGTAVGSLGGFNTGGMNLAGISSANGKASVNVGYLDIQDGLPNYAGLSADRVQIRGRMQLDSGSYGDIDQMTAITRQNPQPGQIFFVIP